MQHIMTDEHDFASVVVQIGITKQSIFTLSHICWWWLIRINIIIKIINLFYKSKIIKCETAAINTLQFEYVLPELL